MRKVKCSNYWKGRGGFKITAIVAHITGSSFSSALNTFQNPNSYVSAHYLLSRHDEVQLVEESDSAWACGRVIKPTWKGLLYRKLEGIDQIEFQGSERGEQGQIIQPMWDKKLGGFTDIINPNLHTLNVEFASKGEFPGWDFWVKGAKFIKRLADEHNLPLDALHITDHNKINARKICPGKWMNSFWFRTLIKFLKI